MFYENLWQKKHHQVCSSLRKLTDKYFPKNALTHHMMPEMPFHKDDTFAKSFYQQEPENVTRIILGTTLQVNCLPSFLKQ